MKIRQKLRKFGQIGLGVLTVSYLLTCLFLFVRQRYLIFSPRQQLLSLPSAADYKLPFANVQIDVKDSRDRIRGWWIAAPTDPRVIAALPNEPINILRSPKTILFFCGAGGNQSYFLARLQGLHQLGFSIFVIDYRGYGQSQGAFPSEAQLYADSQLAWNYLTQVRRIPPQQIVIYGESLGGAIAIDLANNHSKASGLIVQSSFTSLASVIKQHYGLRLFPIDQMLTQHFDSLSKVRSLQVPALFIHGTADTTVPSGMSRQLYAAAPFPKQLHLISGAEHVRIYRPGEQSYLRAIQHFVETIEP